MKLCKTDIKKIRHTTYESEDGYTNIVCKGDTYNLESLLLREILELYDCEIVSERDDEDGDILISTDLEWYEFTEICFEKNEEDMRPNEEELIDRMHCAYYGVRKAFDKACSIAEKDIVAILTTGEMNIDAYAVSSNALKKAFGQIIEEMHSIQDDEDAKN